MRRRAGEGESRRVCSASAGDEHEVGGAAALLTAAASAVDEHEVERNGFWHHVELGRRRGGGSTALKSDPSPPKQPTPPY
jgi:hypothetical protein